MLAYGVDGDATARVVDMVRSRADAWLPPPISCAAHGWRPGAGYQPGEPNFGAIQGWNAASVYQKTIAIVGAQIDGR